MASPDRLSLIVQSDAFDRVHYALVLASAALATGKPVTLFFTMQGTRALTPGWADGAREKALADAGLATFAELLDACRELGAKFMVCEMGLRAAGLSAADLRPDIDIADGSAVSFLADASATGALLYI
ncbi:MAG: DsrE family protein [Rhodospirillaceae bacterium]